jgi:hypothetical protein
MRAETNRATRDIWVPISRQEYDALPAEQRGFVSFRNQAGVRGLRYCRVIKAGEEPPEP